MDKQQILQLANSDPRFVQAVDLMEEKLSGMNLSPEILEQFVATLEYVLNYPDKYPEVRAAAIQRGFAKEQDLPPEFNPVFIISLLAAMYEMQDRAMQPQRAFARGGLASLAAMGRGGDTMLAHINPMEAEVLRRMGGSGTINPNTGLREFKGGGVGDILSIAAPIVLDIVAPGVGSTLAGALGGGLLGSIGSGAIIGGLTSAVTGGDFTKGALSGAMGGGLGSAVGDTVGGLVGGGMSKGVTDALGSSIVGGLGNVIQGKDFGSGALSGAIGSGLGLASEYVPGSGALTEGVQQGMRSAGNALTAGYSPQQALVGGALSGLSAGARRYMRPSELALARGGDSEPGLKMVSSPDSADMGSGQGLRYSGDSGLRAQGGGLSPYNLSGNLDVNPDFAVSYEPGATVAPSGYGADTLGSGLKTPAYAAPTATAAAPGALSKLANLGMKAFSSAPAVLSLLSAAKTPEDIRSAAPQITQGMTPQQQEYFNRALTTWDWNKIAQDAQSRGMTLGQFVARGWNNMVGGQYNTGAATPAQTQVAQVPTFARGGLSRLAQGGGSGRDDTIDARLSDGEYVMDAETVALLGDGSTKAGAQRLDMMRAKLRQHKGKALSKGEISANAKSPLSYLKEAA
jgi:hypothetical protein